jgi:hypothetical protein
MSVVGTDISPEMPNGVWQALPSVAGVALALDGNDTALLVITLNSSVWRSLSGGSWAPLPNAPKRAYCLSVDDSDPSHVLIGERPPQFDWEIGAGTVWESFDFGDSWTCLLDPRALGATSTTVPAVLMSPEGTALVATDSGIARRPAQPSGSGPSSYFSMAGNTQDMGLISALTSSELPDGGVRIWARTFSEIAYSDDEGENWQSQMIPPSVDRRGPQMVTFIRSLPTRRQRLCRSSRIIRQTKAIPSRERLCCTLTALQNRRHGAFKMYRKLVMVLVSVGEGSLNLS